jgi:hypothetical protein
LIRLTHHSRAYRENETDIQRIGNAGGLFRCKLDVRRMGFDPDSGQAILNPPDRRAESCRYFASGITVDYPILRSKS